jgi:hypothetical protein
MGNEGPFPRSKEWTGRDADHSPLLLPRSRINRSYTSSPTWRLQGVKGQLYFTLHLYNICDQTISITEENTLYVTEKFHTIDKKLVHWNTFTRWWTVTMCSLSLLVQQDFTILNIMNIPPSHSYFSVTRSRGPYYSILFSNISNLRPTLSKKLF